MYEGKEKYFDLFTKCDHHLTARSRHKKAEHFHFDWTCRCLFQLSLTSIEVLLVLCFCSSHSFVRFVPKIPTMNYVFNRAHRYALKTQNRESTFAPHKCWCVLTDEQEKIVENTAKINRIWVRNDDDVAHSPLRAQRNEPKMNEALDRKSSRPQIDRRQNTFLL